MIYQFGSVPETLTADITRILVGVHYNMSSEIFLVDKVFVAQPAVIW